MNQELVQAKKAARMEYSELYPQLVAILGYAYQFCGRSPNGKDREQQIEEMNAQISLLIDTLQIGENRSLTVDDIKQAFKEGLNQLTGTNYGLNNETYAKWISAFIAKKKASPTYRKELPAKTEVSEEEKERIFREAFDLCVKVFRETGEVEDLGNAIYRTLWNKGEIRFNKEQWEKYLDEAENIERLRLVNEQSLLKNMGMGKSREQVLRIKQIGYEIEALSAGDKGLEVVARKLALRDYLKAFC